MNGFEDFEATAARLAGPNPSATKRFEAMRQALRERGLPPGEVFRAVAVRLAGGAGLPVADARRLLAEDPRGQGLPGAPESAGNGPATGERVKPGGVNSPIRTPPRSDFLRMVREYRGRHPEAKGFEAVRAVAKASPDVHARWLRKQRGVATAGPVPDRPKHRPAWKVAVALLRSEGGLTADDASRLLEDNAPKLRQAMLGRADLDEGDAINQASAVVADHTHMSFREAMAAVARAVWALAGEAATKGPALEPEDFMDLVRACAREHPDWPQFEAMEATKARHPALYRQWWGMQQGLAPRRGPRRGGGGGRAA